MDDPTGDKLSTDRREMLDSIEAVHGKVAASIATNALVIMTGFARYVALATQCPDPRYALSMAESAHMLNPMINRAAALLVHHACASLPKGTSEMLHKDITAMCQKDMLDLLKSMDIK